MQYYEKNMEILKNRFKKVYDKIKKAEENKLFTIKEVDQDDLVAEIVDQENDFTIYIEKARRGGFTMKIKRDGKEIYFHSKYAPEREAEKIVKDFGFSSKKQVFILGTGLGYYLKQFNKQNKYDKIIVIEPFLAIFYAALCFNNLSGFFSQNNIILLVENNVNIFELTNRYFSLSLEMDFGFLELSPSLKLFNSEYDIIYKKIRESIDYKKINLITDINQAKMWRNNTLLNLPYIYKSPKVDDYFESFNNRPIICVATGPSLNKNIEKLKKVKNKAPIICAGSALKPLLKNNIKPDIVVSMDGTEANFNNFDNIKDDLKDVFLFSEKANYYKINQNWEGPQVFFSMNRNLSSWIEAQKGKYTVIQTGGSVAHSAIDLAYKFGGNPIIMVGQDLAYEDRNGKTHVEGAANISDVNRKLFEVESIYGDSVYADKPLLTMLSYLNNYIKNHNDRIFIDATEGGAKIDNTLILDLDETILKYCNEDLNVFELLKENYYIENKEIGKNEFISNTIISLKNGIDILEKQINYINKLELKLNTDFDKSKEIENEIIKLDSIINKEDILKYFSKKIMLVEYMKYESIKNKYYIDKEKKMKEKYKYYKKYRMKQLQELINSHKILSFSINTYNLM